MTLMHLSVGHSVGLCAWRVLRPMFQAYRKLQDALAWRPKRGTQRMKAIIVCVCCGERRDVQAGVARLPERARDIAKFIHGAEVSSLLPEPGDGYAYDETPQQYVSWAIFARLPRPTPCSKSKFDRTPDSLATRSILFYFLFFFLRVGIEPGLALKTLSGTSC